MTLILIESDEEEVAWISSMLRKSFVCREEEIKQIKILASVLSGRFLRVCWNILSNMKARLLQLSSEGEITLGEHKIIFIEIDTYLRSGFALPVHLVSLCGTTTHAIIECRTHLHHISQPEKRAMNPHPWDLVNSCMNWYGRVVKWVKIQFWGHCGENTLQS